jgi:hypothetical protein
VMATNFLAGGDLPAGVFHVVRFGSFPVSVWDHGSCRGAGVFAGVVSPLTPMMSARLLRTEDAASSHGGVGHHHDTVSDASSRRGFYVLIDRSYTWLLRLSMRHRIVVAVIADSGGPFEYSALSSGQAGVHPLRRRRSRVRGFRQCS